MIKGFVFDMDGVLLDTESVCDRAWAAVGKELGIPVEETLRIIGLCRGTNKKTSKEIIIREFGPDFDADGFMQKTSEAFHSIEEQSGIDNKPFALECLAYLKEKGYRLALASSTRQLIVERELKEAGLFDFFEFCICGDMVKNSKPDPEIYSTAVLKLGLNPSECAAVEDSPNGLLSARKAGLFTIMVPDLIAPSEVTTPNTDLLLTSLSGIMERF